MLKVTRNIIIYLVLINLCLNRNTNCDNKSIIDSSDENNILPIYLNDVELDLNSTNDEKDVTDSTVATVTSTSSSSSGTSTSETTTQGENDESTTVTDTTTSTTEISTTSSTTVETTTEFIPSKKTCKDKVKIESFLITDITNETISLFWNATEDYQDCAQNYKLTWIDTIESNNENNETFPFSVKQEFVITDLLPCRKYNINLQLIGVEDTKLDSQDISNETDSATPSSIKFKATPYEDKIELKWSKPEYAVDCLTGYNISYKIVDKLLLTQETDKREPPPVMQHVPANATSYTISDLESCLEYYIEIFPIGQNNDIGESSNTSLSTKSIVPSDISIKLLVTKNDIEVSWTHPENGEHCVIGYNISYAMKDSSRYETITADNDQYSTTLDLLYCTEYIVKVIALGKDNNNGNEVQNSTETSVSAPSAVDIFLYPSQYSMYVNWTKPSDSYECVIGFNISYSPIVDAQELQDVSDNDSIDNEQITETVDRDVFNLNITDLNPCVKYAVKIRPLGQNNKNGPITKKSEDTQSTAPSSVEITLTPNENKIDAEWTKPENASECVIGYNVTYYRKTNTKKIDTNTITVGKDEYKYTWNDLKFCSEYEIEVLPLGKNNENGEKNSELTSTASTNVSEVQNLQVDTTRTSLTVRWDPPIHQECVDYYEINCYNVGDSEDEVQKNTTKTQEFFNDLYSCTEYKIEVIPIAKDGKDSKSRTLNNKTLESKPGPVRDLNVLLEKQSITITWTMPDISPACVHEYVVRYFRVATPDDVHNTATEMTKVQLSDLGACIVYNISIFPNTTQGLEGPSIDFVNTTLPDVTDKPIYQSKDVGKDYVNLHYQMPNLENNTCPLVKATALCTAVSEIKNWTIKTQSNETPLSNSVENFTIEIKDISPFTKYECYAQIKNSDGLSQQSDVIDFTTDPDCPTAPLLYDPESPKSNEIVIKWDDAYKIPGQFYETELLISPIQIQYFIPDECDKKHDKLNFTNKFDQKTHTYKFIGAMPYTLYTVEMIAKTEAGYGSAVAKNITTKPYVSEAVRNITINTKLMDTEKEYPYHGIVEWNIPCNSSGKIKGFNISVEGSRPRFEPVYYNHFYEVSEQTKIEYDWEMEQLLAEYLYKIIIRAVIENVTEMSEETNCSLFAPAAIPQYIPKFKDKLRVDAYSSDNPKHKAKVKFSKNIFTNIMGEMQYYSIILAQSGYEGAQCSSILTTEDEWPNISGWINTKDAVMPYQVTPVRWNPFASSESEEHIYVIGNEICSIQIDDYCNGPLRPNTNYSIRIRGFTRNGYNETASVYFQTDIQIDIGIMIGIIFTILVMGSCVSFMFYVKNGNPNLWSKKLCSWNGNDTHNSVLPPAISVRNFPAHCLMLFSNESQLSSELLLLETLSDDIALTTYTADLPHNRVKNRYHNIKPYDATRVKLRAVPDEFSNYINASYIKGYNGDIEYIATQGPKEETVDDFWQMVYENEVKQIVMLTNLAEKGKNKCYKYYPDELDTLTCNNGIEIECTTMEFKQTFTTRHIILRKGSQEKNVTHIQFHEWPDFGVPNSTDSVLRLCREMRALQAKNYGVIVIHCSAGVGRTGTVIAIDILVQAVHANRKLDVFGTVFNLRKQRTRTMVQNQEQYKYIYNCIKDEIINPRVFQDRNSYTSFYNRGYPEYLYDSESYPRKLSTESAM